MKKLFSDIEQFFENESFSPRELKDFKQNIKFRCPTRSEKKVCTNKIRIHLIYFKKIKVENNSKEYLYIKRGSKLAENYTKKIDRTLKRDNLDKFRSLKNLELAKKVNLDYVDLIKVLKRFRIKNLDKDSTITNVEFERIRKFIDNRIKTKERKRKRKLLRVYKQKVKDKKRKNQKTKTNLPGVYGKIQKSGGIGKLIYNAMRK